MQVTVNGEPRAVPEGTTASQLLEMLKVQPERVVVELNLNILKRAQLPGAVLKEGDRVEVVHFVGGGSKSRTQDPRLRTFLHPASCIRKVDVWRENTVCSIYLASGVLRPAAAGF